MRRLAADDSEERRAILEESGLACDGSLEVYATLVALSASNHRQAWRNLHIAEQVLDAAVKARTGCVADAGHLGYGGLD